MSNKEAIDKLIAERMAWLRVELFQLTQRELAKELGLTHQHVISEYERALFKPGLGRCLMLIKMAAEHGKKIDMQWLRPDLE